MLLEIWIAAESVMGLLATFLIGILPIGAVVPILFMVIQKQQWGLALLTIAGTPVAVVLAGNVVKMASRVVERNGLIRPHTPMSVCGPTIAEECVWIEEDAKPAPSTPPLALAMAQELRAVPLLVGIPLSLWWLAHFGLALVLGHLSARLAAGTLMDPGAGVFVIVGVVLHMGFLFAANLYLLLATAILFSDEELRTGVWSCRLVVDIILATGSTCAIILFR